MAQLSPAVRAFLEEPRFCVFADINDDGTPHQTVLWYEVQGDTILMNTAKGRVKDRNLTRDPRASFCVEDGYRYVTIVGACTLQSEDQQAAQADIKRLAVRYHGRERGEEMAASSFAKQTRETIRLRIDSAKVDANGFA
jgi:PPOX class probable F420-dependent enzyme